MRQFVHGLPDPAAIGRGGDPRFHALWRPEFADPAPHPPTGALVPPGGEERDLLHPRPKKADLRCRFPGDGVVSHAPGSGGSPRTRSALSRARRGGDEDVRLPALERSTSRGRQAGQGQDSVADRNRPHPAGGPHGSSCQQTDAVVRPRIYAVAGSGAPRVGHSREWRVPIAPGFVVNGPGIIENHSIIENQSRSRLFEDNFSRGAGCAREKRIAGPAGTGNCHLRAPPEHSGRRKTLEDGQRAIPSLHCQKGRRIGRFIRLRPSALGR